MSTHNICFRREIRKILCGYPLLSVAMQVVYPVFHTLVIHFPLYVHTSVNILFKYCVKFFLSEKGS